MWTALAKFIIGTAALVSIGSLFQMTFGKDTPKWVWLALVISIGTLASGSIIYLLPSVRNAIDASVRESPFSGREVEREKQFDDALRIETALVLEKLRKQLAEAEGARRAAEKTSKQQVGEVVEVGGAGSASTLSNPARSGSATKVALNHTDMLSRVAVWIEQQYIPDLVDYTPTVDWYDKGVISREAVLRDRAAYIAKWPERSYTLIPGTVQVTAGGAERIVATFDLNYMVRSVLRNLERSGRTRIMVDLELKGRELLVARQKEILSR